MKIAIFGPQGSGKGTQAELLSARFKIPTISAGAIYRDNIKRQTKLGKLAEKFTTKGVLVPDDITNKMMKAELSKARYKKGIILDGYPRNLNQAKFLDKLMTIDQAILIDINPAEAVRRLSGRRVCSQCGQTYNIKIKRPKKQGICDKCKSKIIQRTDDYPKAIKKRLAIYYQQTRPVLDYYKKKGKLLKIDGQKSIAAVFKNILKDLIK